MEPAMSDDELPRHLARNETVEEQGASQNGAYPSNNPNHDTHPDTAGSSNAYADMDPFDLLKCLTEYSPGSATQTPVSNDISAGLFQAPKNTENQEAANSGRPTRSISPQENQLRSSQISSTQDFFRRSFQLEANDKIEGPESVGVDEEDIFQDRQTSQQKKASKRWASPPVDEAELAFQRELWGPEDDEEYDSEAHAAREGSQQLTAQEAHKLGVNSAAALFRRPTAASSKHARATMSKLFYSFHIDSDEFVKLQAAAKNYMLDKTHPERAATIGGREKGAADMARLALFDCVKAFLEDEGWGERLFGSQSKNHETRKHKWPENKSKVIALVTPLMRRQVTNERQRIYNTERRRAERAELAAALRQKKKVAKSSGPTIDLNLERPHCDDDLAISPELRQIIPQGSDIPQLGAGDGHVSLHVNIMQGGRRIQKMLLKANSFPCYGDFLQYLEDHIVLGNVPEKPVTIQVLGPKGLVDTRNPGAWNETIQSISKHEWMDGEAKCVVTLYDNE